MNVKHRRESEPAPYLGLPASGNAFTCVGNGQQSGFAELAHNDRMAQSAREYNLRECRQGKGDERVRQRRRSQISIDPDPQASAIKQAKLIGRNNHARSQ